MQDVIGCCQGQETCQSKIKSARKRDRLPAENDDNVHDDADFLAAPRVLDTFHLLLSTPQLVQQRKVNITTIRNYCQETAKPFNLIGRESRERSSEDSSQRRQNGCLVFP